MNRRAMFLCIWHKGISIVFEFYLFWLCWVFIAVQVFSVAVSGGCSLAVGQGLLTAVASFIVEHWLSCLWHVGSSWTRD